MAAPAHLSCAIGKSEYFAMLVINLSTSNATYAQGDTVAGQVIFQAGDFHPLATHPVRVLIEITGRTKTKISTSAPSYGLADLFWIRVGELYGSQTVFPFAFAFPARASPVDPSVVDMRGWTKQVLTIRSDHVLPATFNTGNSAFVASVEYRIRASVWTQSQFGPSHILCEQSVPIIFQPRDDPKNRVHTEGEVHKLTTRRTVKSSLLLSEGQAHKRKKSRFLWHRSEIPSVQFQLQLTVPVKIHLGEEIPCLLSITPLSQSLSLPERLAFTLRGFSISVKGKTKVWTSAGIEGDQTKSQSEIILDESNQQLNVLLSPQSGYSKAILSPAIQSTTPTLETYNIKCTYVMRVSADVGCSGVINTISGETELVVLPGTGDYICPPEGRTQGGVDIVDASHLPSYVEATSNIIQEVSSLVG